MYLLFLNYYFYYLDDDWKNKHCGNCHCFQNLRHQTLIRSGNEPTSKLCRFLLFSNVLFNLIFLLVLFICAFGIVLPFLPTECKYWLWNQLFSNNDLKDYSLAQVTCLPRVGSFDDTDYNSNLHTCNTQGFKDTIRKSYAESDQGSEEFKRQFYLALDLFKTGFQNVFRAFLTLDTSVALANLSWFILGKFLFKNIIDVK